MQRHLSAEEWAHAAKMAGSGWGLGDLAFLVPWMAEELDRTTLDRVLGEGGLGMRILLVLSRGRFARTEAVAFRHV